MASTTSLAVGDAPFRSINTTFADGNHGLQAATITGPVNAEFHHHAPERVETPPAPLSTVPFRRDPDFVQRGALLEEVTSKLSRPAARVALVGLGGVGKSQLAIEYSHQVRTQAPETWVLWLYASNSARFEQSVRDALDRLRVRGRQEVTANVFQLLHDWLCDGRSRPWLVILDNADDARVLGAAPSVRERADDGTTSARQEKALLEYLPQCEHGKILVTSRSRDAAKELVDWKEIVAVEPMEAEQAVALLEKKLDRVYDVQDVTLVALAQALDFMPLAMVQAAAYICQRAGRYSVREYMEKLGRCDRSNANVLEIDEPDLRRDREASNSIMLTWQISFNHIREVRPSASDLLSLMSFFDRQAIPEALLQERGGGQSEGRNEYSAVDSEGSERSSEDAGTGNSSEGNAAVAIDRVEEYEKDIIVLRNYSLVSSTADRAVFEMHRLVQIATKKWLRGQRQFNWWASQFISNLEKAFPTSDIDNWPTCQSLFPHTVAALHIEATGRETNLQLATLLLRSGIYASAVGVYIDAEKVAERCLKLRKEVLGEEHPHTLTSMNNLASTYWKQGRWSEAEKFQVEVLKKSKEVLGERHPHTLMSMTNLASTYWQQGRWSEAEKVKLEVLEKSKEVLGERHPDTLMSMANLASTYMQQGRLQEAEKLGVEVLEKRKEVLGEAHPDTLRSMANLAFTLRSTGRRQSALNLISLCEDMSQARLGIDHPASIARFSCRARWEAEDSKDKEGFTCSTT